MRTFRRNDVGSSAPRQFSSGKHDVAGGDAVDDVRSTRANRRREQLGGAVAAM